MMLTTTLERRCVNFCHGNVWQLRHFTEKYGPVNRLKDTTHRSVDVTMKWIFSHSSYFLFYRHQIRPKSESASISDQICTMISYKPIKYIKYIRTR